MGGGELFWFDLVQFCFVLFYFSRNSPFNAGVKISFIHFVLGKFSSVALTVDSFPTVIDANISSLYT